MATGNIMGGPFEEWVTNQIEARQQSLGQGSGLNTQNLLYQQSKTPWLRLASSVDLHPDEEGAIDILKRLGGLPGINLNEITGPGAAKNFILQGGAISIGGFNEETKTVTDFKQNSGLNLTNRTFNGAYGWGGVSDRGLVPMPGITGASVKFLNNGALTKTEINIKCYSRNQFALVDALYMRPGYSLLLEFGWSNYLQTTSKDGVLTGNEVKLETYDNLYSQALSYLFDPNFTEANQFKLVHKILTERKKRSGNYEGVYGKITNFKWTFNPDGTYDCIVYLTGLGEVIESMKVNIAAGSEEGYYNSKMKVNGEEEEEKDDDIPLIANARKTTINSILFNLYQSVVNPDVTPIQNKIDQRIGNDWSVKVAKWAFKKIKNLTGKDQEDQVIDYPINNFPLVDNEGNLTHENILISGGLLTLGGTKTDDDDNQSPQVYITFGAFIALLQKNIVTHTAFNKCPYFTFDMNFQNLNEDKNYIKKLPGQFSSNPLICLIPYDNHNITKSSFDPENKEIQAMDIKFLQVPGNNLNDTLKQGAKWNADVYLGRLSCVYLNINHIAKVLDTTPKDDDGTKSLLDFMNNLIRDMSNSLGGINDIVLKNNAEGTKIKFFENIPQRFTNKPSPPTPGKMCRFNTFGFTNEVGGSIVRNLGIDGSISSNFSTMITIGAQSNGNQIAGNATSFSNYNNGIIDRVIPTKINMEVKEELTADTNKDGQITDEEQEDFDEANAKSEAAFISQATNINKSLRAIMDKGDPNASGWSKLGHWITTWEGGGVFEDIYNDRQWKEDDLETLMELNTQYVSLLDGINTQSQSNGGTGQLDAPFFLPFNFNMEIDGMGGMQLMQKFKLDEKILPPTYDKDSVEIIIRGINHEINESAWLTKLDTQSTPVAKDIPVSNPNPLAKSTSKKSSTPLELPPNPQPPGDELLRMRVTRIMDDGTQTLGIMDILEEDEQTVMFSLATSELPWLGNQNEISCIPTDNYLVKSHVSGKHGRCFWLVGNEKGDYDFNRLKGNGYTRAAVLIHMFPKAPGWALGCIGPGLTFNNKDNQKGRQKGTGQFYLDPSKAQSTQAMNKLLSTLYKTGSFKLEIKNVTSSLPNRFDYGVQMNAQTLGKTPLLSAPISVKTIL